ncbi:MAG: hypothetical protein J2P47_09930, partial [Acetobacteraceae bacterium]|nr:hypothetical protein [Acetobacteraceae bacterium]
RPAEVRPHTALSRHIHGDPRLWRRGGRGQRDARYACKYSPICNHTPRARIVAAPIVEAARDFLLRARTRTGSPATNPAGTSGWPFGDPAGVEMAGTAASRPV